MNSRTTPMKEPRPPEAAELAERQKVLDRYDDEIDFAFEYVRRTGKQIDPEWAAALIFLHREARPLFRRSDDDVPPDESYTVLAWDIGFTLQLQQLTKRPIDSEWARELEERRTRILEHILVAATTPRPDDRSLSPDEESALSRTIEEAEETCRVALESMRAELSGDANRARELMVELLERNSLARETYFEWKIQRRARKARAREARVVRAIEAAARSVAAAVTAARADLAAADATDKAHTCWRTSAPPPPIAAAFYTQRATATPASVSRPSPTRCSASALFLRPPASAQCSEHDARHGTVRRSRAAASGAAQENTYV